MNANVEQLVGRTLGQRYRLERTLGVGGMGAVFEATQLDLGRTVAVKVLLDVDPRGIARLRQEALTAGSLSCPHVVSIFDFVAPDGEPPFIVMEILPGHSLATLLRQEPMLGFGRAARIASQMLIGLAAAHRAGVIHRDVKPSNTWLVYGPGIDEHVKMLDFGIAKMLGDGASLRTTTGSVLGTPAYLAPEQLRGLPLDARVDIHAMGVVLFEMLTGARPWQSNTASVYAEILERRPPPIHLLAPNIPPALSQVVERALAKDPAARFPRAEEMRLALEPFVDVSAPTPPTAFGGLGAETGDCRRPQSMPPRPAAFGAAPASTMQAVVASTAGVLPLTLDHMTGAHVARTGSYLPPPYAPSAAPNLYASAPPFASSPAFGSGGYPIQSNPLGAPPARSTMLPFLLGGAAVLIAGTALAAAFILGKSRSSEGAGGAATATSDGAIGAAAVAPGTPTNDAGVTAAGASSPAGAKGGRAGAPDAGGAPDAAAAAGPTSAKCSCVSPRNQRICTTPKPPSCTCSLPGGGASICPKPWVGGDCAGGLAQYGKPGRKDGQPCSGFLSNDGTRSVTGVTECQFCYGNDTVAGVPGAPCKGIGVGGGAAIEEGKLACDK